MSKQAMQSELVVRIFDYDAVPRIEDDASNHGQRLLRTGNDQNVGSVAQHASTAREIIGDCATQWQIASRRRIGRAGAKCRGGKFAPPRMKKSRIDQRLTVE